MYGGGYSFHSSQYGLGVDQILEYTLVLPDGEVKKVTAKSDGRLFNALKGSGNNASPRLPLYMNISKFVLYKARLIK